MVDDEKEARSARIDITDVLLLACLVMVAAGLGLIHPGLFLIALGIFGLLILGSTREEPR